MQNKIIQKLETLLLVTVPSHLLDSEVLALKRSALQGLRRHRSRWVLLDFSQVDVCDSYFGRFIYSMAETCRLMGARVIVCGLQDGVVETLVEMGFELDRVVSVLDLDDALEYSRLAEAEAEAEAEAGSLTPSTGISMRSKAPPLKSSARP